MSQVLLEFSNQDDLILLLSFAKRLNVKVVSVKKEREVDRKSADERLELMKQAAQDPLFLGDVAEIMDDFAHADQDEL